MADISCTFGESTVDDQLRAKLRKPEGFQGAPIFADDRKLDPATSQDCQIRPDPTDPTGHMYDLLVRDLSKCGVVVRNVSNLRMSSMYEAFLLFYTGQTRHPEPLMRTTR